MIQHQTQIHLISNFTDTKYVISVGTVVVEMGVKSEGYIKIVLK